VQLCSIVEVFGKQICNIFNYIEFVYNYNILEDRSVNFAIVCYFFLRSCGKVYFAVRFFMA